ncbi:hypothetical protein E1263_34025 [Kribbella antibiotica]|uniref:SMP-30/Gluconolactonase/LRE-like region domain-containing protein n=1 Tax=Kribbella antibiotica TaxID=190195 RepID=A0A4R4YSY2_9ACTN|nr:hypothetical protein [Kribbella antibiotica]TDD47810.1 hypothetical protein E1263_34025 [Kribbella antibiotica]
MLRITAAVAAVLALTAPAAAPASARPVPTPSPVSVVGHTPDRYPEGIAWDPSRRAFLIGSIATGRISVVGRDGVPHPYGVAPGISTFGLHVDARRNRVLATYADIGSGERSSEATAYKQSGVAVYDLRSGRLLQRIDLNTKRLNPVGGRHGANDLAIDAVGNAYVADPAGDAIYKIGRSGHASVLVRDARLKSDSIGMNGIVWDPAGFLLAVRYDTGALLRITPAGRISEVAVGKKLIGGDGLAMTTDRRLVAVTNKLGAPGVEELTVLSSVDGYRSAVVRSVQAWPVAGPTTAAVTPAGIYVLSGGIDVLLAGGSTDQFTIRRG